MAEWMPVIGVLVGACIITSITALSMSCVLLRSMAPNWLKSTRSLPVPRNVGKRSGWKSAAFRDSAERQWTVPCYVRHSEEGVLVRDLWYGASYSWVLFPKFHTMFIPWAACSNPREPWGHWSQEAILKRRFVEFDVNGQQFSILLDPRMVKLYAPNEFSLGVSGTQQGQRVTEDTNRNARNAS